MDDDTLNIILVMAFSIFSTFFGGIAGFGYSIIFQALWLGFQRGSFIHSVPLLLIQSVTSSFACGFYSLMKGSVRKDITVVIIIGMIPMVYLGQYLLLRVDQDLLKKIFGVVLLGFTAWQGIEVIRKESVPHPPSPSEKSAYGEGVGLPADSATALGMEEGGGGGGEMVAAVMGCGIPITTTTTTTPLPPESITLDNITTPSHPQGEEHENQNVAQQSKLNCWHWVTKFEIWGAYLTGLASGLMMGLFGAGGPPMMIYMTLVQLDKAFLRGTSMSVGIIIQPWGITSAWIQGLFVKEDWALYLVAPISALIGLFLGDLAYRKISNYHVKLILLGLILLASVLFSSPGLDPFLPLILTAIYLLLALILVIFLIAKMIKKMKSRPQTSSDGDTTPLLQRLEGQRDNSEG